MRRAPLLLAVLLVAPLASCGRAQADRVTAIGILTRENFDRLAPAGKEADAIIGDYVMSNEHLVAVIGNPVPGRDANASVQGVGGAVIDLTVREHPNDLLSVFHPGGGYLLCGSPRIEALGVDGSKTAAAASGLLEGHEVRFACDSPSRAGRPQARLIYSLRQGEPFLTVTTEWSNPTSRPINLAVEDLLRVDGPSFERMADGDDTPAWAYDPWFGQAYGVAGDGIKARVMHQGDSLLLRWLVEGRTGITLEPGQSSILTRRLFPGRDLVEVKAIDARARGLRVSRLTLQVTDPAGLPVAADVVVTRQGASHAKTRTLSDGKVTLVLPEGGPYRLKVSSPGMGERAVDVPEGGQGTIDVALDAGSRLFGKITDGNGMPIPAKIIINGVEGTETPDLGPEVGATEVKNLIYTSDGTFKRVLSAGRYEVIAAHGPEFDAVTRRVEIPPGGAEVPFTAALKRTVDTKGWVSADFHGHTTASGDTTASRHGRVLNLAAEGIEFAPSTEHNRLDTYQDLIESLGLTRFLKSCPGIELTREPFRVNHQNAFPLILHEHTQGNGAPLPDADPVAQIRRLSAWDNGSEKLVQQNHPDIGWIWFDGDGDGTPDGGLAGMFPFQQAVEAWGDDIIKLSPWTYRQTRDAATGQTLWVRENNPIFNWLQLLNTGVRIPAVANTDAHTNYHGSGGRRNYVKSPTDDPLEIEPLEIVRSAARGHIIITNGPFLEVSLRPAGLGGADSAAYPGDEIAVPGGRVMIRARVQCPNWIDIDRVHLVLNGRPDVKRGWTRYNDPHQFADGPVKFDSEIDLTLERDTHVIVVAWHKVKMLAAIMGPEWGDFHPTAISNPIFIDVDGGGFRANGDTLGHPLPVKAGHVVAGPPGPEPPVAPVTKSGGG